MRPYIIEYYHWYTPNSIIYTYTNYRLPGNYHVNMMGPYFYGVDGLLGKKSGMTFAKIGYIERLKFAGTEMNQHSGKT